MQNWKWSSFDQIYIPSFVVCRLLVSIKCHEIKTMNHHQNHTWRIRDIFENPSYRLQQRVSWDGYKCSWKLSIWCLILTLEWSVWDGPFKAYESCMHIFTTIYDNKNKWEYDYVTRLMVRACDVWPLNGTENPCLTKTKCIVRLEWRMHCSERNTALDRTN